MIHTSAHSLTTVYSGTAAIGLGNRTAWHDNVMVFSENADFDQDGDVDGTDLWLFRQHFSQAAAKADLSKDGYVDELDVRFFGANMGKPFLSSGQFRRKPGDLHHRPGRLQRLSLLGEILRQNQFGPRQLSVMKENTNQLE